MMTMTEFIEAFCSLTPEAQEALTEFTQGLSDPNATVEQALDRVSNERLREDYRKTLIANGNIA